MSYELKCKFSFIFFSHFCGRIDHQHSHYAIGINVGSAGCDALLDKILDTKCKSFSQLLLCMFSFDFAI